MRVSKRIPERCWRVGIEKPDMLEIEGVGGRMTQVDISPQRLLFYSVSLLVPQTVSRRYHAARINRREQGAAPKEWSLYCKALQRSYR